MQDCKTKHIKLVHADAIVSAGIAAILRSRDDMIVLTSGDEACDILITDYAAALEFCAIAKLDRADLRHRPRVVVVTCLDREWDVRMAMEAGVHGYVLQGGKPEQLTDAVTAVYTGLKYVSGELAPKLADCLTRDELTAREFEVLKVMSTGASNRAISVALGIADTTVKAHVRAILSKVGACARAEAIAIAARRGLTSPGH
jgi:DNA-binding NarL/FixJ family response regulator